MKATGEVSRRRAVRHIPTMGFEPRIGDRVTAAIENRDAQALNRLGVPWFDWRYRRWRLDHEGWMHTHGWRSAPEYGGRLHIRASSRRPVPERPRFADEEYQVMAKLKVVPKAEEEGEESETPSPKAKKKVAKKEGGAKVANRFVGVTTGMGVRDFQNQLMAQNFKRKFTDEQLAALMRKEFPHAVPYTTKHVAGIRGSWNKGLHGNDKPERPLPEFDELGKPQAMWGEKTAAKRAAKAVEVEEETEEEVEEPKPRRKRKVS